MPPDLSPRAPLTSLYLCLLTSPPLTTSPLSTLPPQLTSLKTLCAPMLDYTLNGMNNVCFVLGLGVPLVGNLEAHWRTNSSCVSDAGRVERWWGGACHPLLSPRPLGPVASCPGWAIGFRPFHQDSCSHPAADLFLRGIQEFPGLRNPGPSPATPILAEWQCC